MNRVAEVNKALKAQGATIKLRAGRDYYYFDGDASGWPSSSVYVYRASVLSVAEWLRTFSELKLDAEIAANKYVRLGRN